MYLTLIILPLLGSIASGFFGRKSGITGSHIIACTCVIITTILSFVAFTEVAFNNIVVSINLFKWVDSESLNVLWGFNFDSLTVSMLIPVLVVSSLVHIYSIEYMSHDPHNQRFFSYLSLFTFMMIILVTANNFLLMFVGWEGVGVCSYLLVSFWFTRIAANQSSLAAFLTNRVGDCLLTVGMFALLWSFGNIDYNVVFSIAPFINENMITVIGICFLIGAMAKSSQVGLHIWLPMAMEGPTPVSALIHAATMVTAGVYLLMRSSPLLEYSTTVLICCLWLGAITTVFSSLIGLFQQDIKKVIAYSTMSQLGMMVIAIGLSSYNLALFHLVNHAFYKALLFLGAGAVIHAVSDNQDFRKFGGLRHFLPLTYSVMLIASLSLVAFPFMTGFYSKDFILESAYGQFTFSGISVYFIATIGAMFTTLYSIKVLYLTFLSNPFGPITNYDNAHEGKIFMSLPLVVLAIFSIFFGYITKDLFIGMGTGLFIDNSIFIHPNNEYVTYSEFGVPTFYKMLPFLFTILLILFSLILLEFKPQHLLLFKFTNLGNKIFGFFNQRFLIELFYNKYIVNLVFKLGGQTTKNLDKGSVELFGPYGLEKGLLNLSRNLSVLELGIVTTYALYIGIGLISFVLIVYLNLYQLNILILIIFSIFVNSNIASARPHRFVKAPLQSSVPMGGTVYTGTYFALAGISEANDIVFYFVLLTLFLMFIALVYWCSLRKSTPIFIFFICLFPFTKLDKDLLLDIYAFLFTEEELSHDWYYIMDKEISHFNSSSDSDKLGKVNLSNDAESSNINNESGNDSGTSDSSSSSSGPNTEDNGSNNNNDKDKNKSNAQGSETCSKDQQGDTISTIVSELTQDVETNLAKSAPVDPQLSWHGSHTDNNGWFDQDGYEARQLENFEQRSWNHIADWNRLDESRRELEAERANDQGQVLADTPRPSHVNDQVIQDIAALQNKVSDTMDGIRADYHNISPMGVEELPETPPRINENGNGNGD